MKPLFFSILFLLFGAAMTAQNAPQSTQTPQAAKCTAQTQRAAQCQNKAKYGAFCAIHDPNAPICGADKKTGGKCRRHVQIVGEKCASHRQPVPPQTQNQ